MSESLIKQMKPEQLAQQLRAPTGQIGHQIANAMNESNAEINRACIAHLQSLMPGPGVADLKDTPRLEMLEIGPGNAGFLDTLFALFKGLSYTGLDGSEDMVTLASAAHAKRLKANRAQFIQGIAQKMPFPTRYFDSVLSVNTLYFWPNLKDTLREISRVLKPDGVLCLGFGDPHFMAQMPFTNHGFQLYSAEQVRIGLKDAGFEKVQHQEHRILSQDSPEVLKKHFHCIGASLCL
jgi:ubiquinone/menaquinone biosynthesis C-methylase UbiE